MDELREGMAVLLTLSIFVCVLEGLNQAQSLVHRTTHRQVVNGDLPQDALIVNHKETPEIHKMMLQFCTHTLEYK